MKAVMGVQREVPPCVPPGVHGVPRAGTGGWHDHQLLPSLFVCHPYLFVFVQTSSTSLTAAAPTPITPAQTQTNPHTHHSSRLPPAPPPPTRTPTRSDHNTAAKSTSSAPRAHNVCACMRQQATTQRPNQHSSSSVRHTTCKPNAPRKPTAPRKPITSRAAIPQISQIFPHSQ